MEKSFKDSTEARIRDRAEKEAEGLNVARKGEVQALGRTFGLRRDEAETVWRRVGYEGADLHDAVKEVTAARTITAQPTVEVPDEVGDYAKPQV